MGKPMRFLFFLNYIPLTQDKQYKTWAIQAEHFLSSSAIETKDTMTWSYPGLSHPILGMAHGNAGISLAYGKLYEITGNQRYMYCLEKIIRYEHQRYRDELRDWIDYRKEGCEKDCIIAPAAWCHGAGGILSARLELVHLDLPDHLQNMIQLDIQRAVQKIKLCFARENLCLCHGISGNLLIMRKYLRYFQDIEMEKQCNQAETYLCECIKNKRIELIRERYGMGLMTGYGGILLTLLL